MSTKADGRRRLFDTIFDFSQPPADSYITTPIFLNFLQQFRRAMPDHRIGPPPKEVP